ncbi:MAG: hypothetical protein JWM28_1266 [Chitinophagaceae bacterium]|nr:hypothetical protein [Chitinophagaceae bacterium]
MAKKIKKETKKQLLKSTKDAIRGKIEGALTDLKAGLGEKEFKKRLKKAAALFSEGFIMNGKTTSAKKEKKKPQKVVVPEPVVDITV